MNTLRQCWIISLIALRSLPARRWTGLVIVAGMAIVVGVLLSMLSVSEGLARASLLGKSPADVIVLPRDTGAIDRSWVGTIADAPGVARRSTDGAPLADAEVNFQPPPIEGFVSGSLQLEGFGPMGFAIRPRLRILAGRAFRPGAQEAIAGAAAAKRFGLRVGSTISMPGGPWPIVGIFADQESLIENSLVADAETILSSLRRKGFNVVLLRLVDASAFPGFRDWVSSNPALSVTVRTQQEQALTGARRSMSFFTQMAYVIGAIMALGAMFGAVKIMYAAVRTRTRELGTLRALGFGPAAVAASVLLEAAILALTGALLGAAIAWVIFEGREIYVWAVFKLHLPLALVAMALAWSVGIAVLSGVFPALRAARMPTADALRAD